MGSSPILNAPLLPTYKKSRLISHVREVLIEIHQHH